MRTPKPRGATFADILALPSRPPDERVAYGADANQFGHLRLPSARGPALPIVVLIHGGCWESEYDLTHADALATAVVDLGVACWSIEYRRIGDAGGGWPGTFRDVGRGVDFVSTLAKTHPIDLSRIVLMGHSAGGHLALWAAGRSRLSVESAVAAEHPLRVSAVVALAGITDLRRADEEHVCGDAPCRLLGGPAAIVPDRYAQASPAERLPLGVRQRLIHGSADTIVPVSFSTSYADAASAKGDDARAVIVEGAGHFDVISPESEAWRAVGESLEI
jgi:acetyl esterase/lipase